MNKTLLQALQLADAVAAIRDHALSQPAHPATSEAENAAIACSASAYDTETPTDATGPPLVAIYLARSVTYIAAVLAVLASGYTSFSASNPHQTGYALTTPVLYWQVCLFAC